jgi:hypothetical protein
MWRIVSDGIAGISTITEENRMKKLSILALSAVCAMGFAAVSYAADSTTMMKADTHSGSMMKADNDSATMMMKDKDDKHSGAMMKKEKKHGDAMAMKKKDEVKKSM